MTETNPESTDRESIWSVFLAFLKLGLTSFGGPVAHLGYFRDEFVTRRKWLDDSSYSDLVALCQFLPGPASSQVGMGLGLSKGGYAGALAAWVGFTMPSAILLILFALGMSAWSEFIPIGFLHGLKAVAVAVVAQAVWGMANSFCTDNKRILFTIVSASFILLSQSVWSQLMVIVLSGVISVWIFDPAPRADSKPLPISVNHRAGISLLVMFFGMLFMLPLALTLVPSGEIRIIDSFYRSGSLVFGGGHVVLPLLQAEVVPQGLVTTDAFLAGYGAAQAVPGPLFTFAAFLGASMTSGPSGWYGGFIALLAIFLPSFLLVTGVLPLWEKLRQNKTMQAALIGINASVVGLLVAALYNPVWTSGITQPRDFVLAMVAFASLMYWKIPPWMVVIGGGCLGVALF